MSLQDRKIYWLPNELTKYAAVAEIAHRIGASRILAAGDSLLDVDLLQRADAAIAPRHGELHSSGWSAAPHVRRTACSGLLAGEEIVEWFHNNAFGHPPSPGVDHLRPTACPPAGA
ncbi:MAG: hypothetical protein ACRDRL_27490, partial [Sciscionella sp.]